MKRTLIFLYGIRRSGNHVLHNFLLHQYEPPCHRILNVKYNIMALKESEGKQLVKDYNLLLIGFESYPLATILGVECDNYFEKSLGIYDEVKNVIVLRDPWNLFASRLAHGTKRLRHAADYLWVEYAKAFIDKPYDAEYVNYNEFITNESYRRALSERIGGLFDDSSIDEVLNHGGGSSFDGMSYNGRGREMDVFHRWKVYRDDPKYKELFTPEIEELAGKLFGQWKPGAM